MILHLPGIVAVALASAVFLATKPGGWTTLYTPDSEFYMSLGAFGGAVTQHAGEPAYYWTRLGEILPLYALSSVLGPTSAHAAYSAMVVGLVAAGAYAAAHLSTGSRAIGAFTGFTVATSVVTITWAGDPYNTGTCIALLTLTAALLIRMWMFPHRWQFGCAACVGIALAWLLMTNPSAAIIGIASSAAGGTLVLAIQRNRRNVLVMAIRVAVACVGFSTSMAAFILIGQRVFRPLEWIPTVRFWGRVVSQSASAWMSPTLEWLRAEYSLWAFVAIAVATCFYTARYVVGMRKQAHWLLLVLAVMPILVFSLQYARTPGASFEAGFYNAMLLPLPLLAITILAAAHVKALIGRAAVHRKALPVVIFVASSAVYLLIGWSMPVIGLASAVAILVSIVLSPIFVRLATRKDALGAAAIWAAIVIALIPPNAVQALTSARPADVLGVFQHPRYTLGPDAGREIEWMAKADYEVETWILASVRADERIAVVANGPTPAVSAAAMQLWGPNSIYFPAEQPFPTAAQLGSPPPDVVAFYGVSSKTCDGIATLYASEGVDAMVRGTLTVGQGASTLDVCLVATRR